MKVLQDSFDSQIQEQFSSHKIATRLINKRLSELGITLTGDQLADIERELLNFQGDTITVTIDEAQSPLLDPKLKEAIKGTLCINLADSERDLEDLLDHFAESLSAMIPEVVEEVSDPMLRQLKRGVPSMLKSRRKETASFEARLRKAWRKPLDLLETFLAIALEAGDDFNQEVRPKASEENDFVFEVLTRLHARACQVASEILILLKSGYADGAHGRWRSLHEIAVVGLFIQSAGNEIAERYLLHDGVESYKASLQYQKHCDELGYQPVVPEELKKIESTYDGLINRFGCSYKEDYGWAAPAVPSNSNRPTFKDIESEAGMARLRPFYRMACHNVHANPKGIFFKLGLHPGSQDVLLAGPSNTGLADPIQDTAISLGQITSALLTSTPNIDRLVICKTLMKLEEEIGQEALAAQQLLESDGTA